MTTRAIKNVPKLVGISDSVGANDACLWLDERFGEYWVHIERWFASRIFARGAAVRTKKRRNAPHKKKKIVFVMRS